MTNCLKLRIFFSEVEEAFASLSLSPAEESITFKMDWERSISAREKISARVPQVRVCQPDSQILCVCITELEVFLNSGLGILDGFSFVNL